MRFPKIFAHRGLSSKAPENTLASFKKALNFDIDGVEFDVQMTKDRKLVVIHDEKLDRTTNSKGLVKDLTYDELATLDAGGWFSDKYINERIPLLEDVLELFVNKDILINIELKNSVFEYSGMEKDVLTLVKELGIIEKTIISSFNHYSLRKVRDLDSNIQTAILCYATMFEPLDYLRSVGANTVHTCIETVNAELVNHLHKNGIEIRCYTVNHQQILKKLIELGVDGIFTDKADEFVYLTNC